MKIKKIFIKKIIPLLLVTVFCISLISCKPKNEFICENEIVGEDWEKFVLNYKENLDLIEIYPPIDYNTELIFLPAFERYKVSDKETIDLIMPILMEIGEYVTEVGNYSEAKGDIYRGKISKKCSLYLSSNNTKTKLFITLCENLILVGTSKSVCFVTKENISELGGEIMRLAKDNGVYTTDMG